MRLTHSFFLLLSLLLTGLVCGKVTAYTPETASFSVTVNGHRVPYKIFSAFLLPHEAVTVDVGSVDKTLPLRLETTAGQQRPTGAAQWRWEAPASVGLYPMKVVRGDTGETVLVNAFVMQPFKALKGEYLNGYHIGQYPTPFGKTFQLPRGFIEVTAANQDTLLSPHFRLNQFLCKQSGSFPKYLVLRESLVEKLELTLAAVNRQGFRYEGFHIMSGYRTPAYNRSLGNVSFSRHMLGEAADLLMDGAKSQTITATNLFKLVDETQRTKGGGGLGKYHGNKRHGPFVHVDVRDYLARWEG